MRGKAVYFVGAGLPKALQQAEYPIPLMWDFVKVAAGYAETDDVLLTTLAQLEVGGVFEHSTAASRALAEKVTPPRVSTAEDRAEFLRVISSRPQENIEDLLIRADQLATNAKSASLSFADRVTLELLPLRFSFAINRVFWRIGWNFIAAPLDAFLIEELARRERTTFVSFNYDLILEHGIENVAPNDWCATTGYGSAFPEFVEVEVASKHVDHLSTRGGGAVGTLKSHVTTRTSSDRMTILKPHGSLSWLCQFNGNYRFVGHPTHPVLSADERVAYLSGNNVQLLERPKGMPWPNTGIFISPPTQKIPLPTILAQEEDAIVDADDVVIVGWSAPPTDRDQVSLIQKAIKRRGRPFRSVTLIEFFPIRSQVRRMRELFAPADRFRLWVGGFETYPTRSVWSCAITWARWMASRRFWS